MELGWDESFSWNILYDYRVSNQGQYDKTTY